MQFTKKLWLWCHATPFPDATPTCRPEPLARRDTPLSQGRETAGGVYLCAIARAMPQLQWHREAQKVLRVLSFTPETIISWKPVYFWVKAKITWARGDLSERPNIFFPSTAKDVVATLSPKRSLGRFFLRFSVRFFSVCAGKRAFSNFSILGFFVSHTAHSFLSRWIYLKYLNNTSVFRK